MYQATIAEAERRYGSPQPLFNYRWEHVQAVHSVAVELARLTGADQEVVEAAVWLHDIAKEEGSNHPQAGAAYARRFLPQTDFPEEKIDVVAQVIADHMGLWREEPLQQLESQVLWDADKLAKLGLTAAFHWLGLNFAEAEAESETITVTGMIARGRDAEWQEKTVASMHTAPGKRAAAARLRAFNGLWDQLEGELEGQDLA